MSSGVAASSGNFHLSYIPADHTWSDGSHYVARIAYLFAYPLQLGGTTVTVRDLIRWNHRPQYITMQSLLYRNATDYYLIHNETPELPRGSEFRRSYSNSYRVIFHYRCPAALGSETITKTFNLIKNEPTFNYPGPY